MITIKTIWRKTTKSIINASDASAAYIRFIAYIIVWFVVLILITPLLAGLLNNSFHTNFQIGDFILFVTAAFLVATTYETRKMRIQTRQSELRPVILRHGYISDWNEIKFTFNKDKQFFEGKPLEFKVVKGIATDIFGYIILNKKKYPLLFGSEISRTSDESYFYNEKWGWLESGSRLFAMYKNEDGKSTLFDNRIYIGYRDIEGKEYYSIEYADFTQESFSI